MNTTRALAVPAALAVTAILVTGAGPAMAKDGRVTAAGSCSSSGTWKLKASPENGRIEVEAEVDTNRNGQRWAWTMTHNGGGAVRGTSTTQAPSGSFEVRRVMSNAAGTDTFAFTAQRTGTSQVCRGIVRF
jgi:hypothetical protein